MRSDTVYATNDAVCGTPRDFYKIKEVDGKTVHYCPNCERLSIKVKNCLRCEKTMTPTCRLMHICRQCAYQNEKFKETFVRDRVLNTDL